MGYCQDYPHPGVLGSEASRDLMASGVGQCGDMEMSPSCITMSLRAWTDTSCFQNNSISKPFRAQEGCIGVGPTSQCREPGDTQGSEIEHGGGIPPQPAPLDNPQDLASRACSLAACFVRHINYCMTDSLEIPPPRSSSSKRIILFPKWNHCIRNLPFFL